MINEENIVSEYLALGKLDLALEEAKKNGFDELAKKIESSLLKDKNSECNRQAEASPLPERFTISLTVFEHGFLVGVIQRWIDENGETGKTLMSKLTKALENGNG